MAKKIIYTPYAPEPIGPYSQAVEIGNTLYVSGQIPLEPGKNSLISADVRLQAKQVMQNLKAIVEAASYTLDDVVKCTIFIKNMSDFAQINEIYAQYFDADNAPARETVEIARLPKDVLVEISCIAAKG
jgi:2-iminobutanoate/2-iminopropanoate deaminase